MVNLYQALANFKLITMKSNLHFIKSVFITVLILSSYSSFAQNNFPHHELRHINRLTKTQKLENHAPDYKNQNISSIASTIHRHNRILDNLHFPNSQVKSDTLYIGNTPNDSIYITGTYSYNGTIAVIGDGKLVFDNCNATIDGDILVFGSDAKLWITDSYITCPQSFIYERALVAALAAEIFVTNSTLNYFGISHDLVITDNAIVNWNNVTNLGFTTCGMSLDASININTTNQAGEYVMTHNATANYENAETILIWHHIPEASELDVIFPDGENISSHSFSDTSSGVTGIDYYYSITNCTDIMWGLMPEPNSSLTVTDSEIRAIGVWFKDLPDYEVSGLVNSSQYADFTAPLSNHNIHFVNTFVRTWNLYMFHGATGVVGNCILGEIGTMGNSSCSAENCLIDGSGGYLFATDTSVMTSAFSYLNCNFQSSGNAYGIMAYGGQNMGRCIAFEKSIMIILQANLTEEPEYKDDAMMWYLRIDNNGTEYTESFVPIMGSAWIEKASDYYAIDFDWLVVSYQANGSEEWVQIEDTIHSEVFDAQICEWNTEGINSGSYTIKLTMCDNSDDTNQVEVVKQIVLTENPTNVKDYSLNNIIKVFPNPTTGIINIEAENLTNVTIYSIEGRLIENFDKTNQIDLSFLKTGIYLISIKNNLQNNIQRVVITDK